MIDSYCRFGVHDWGCDKHHVHCTGSLNPIGDSIKAVESFLLSNMYLLEAIIEVERMHMSLVSFPVPISLVSYFSKWP